MYQSDAYQISLCVSLLVTSHHITVVWSVNVASWDVGLKTDSHHASGPRDVFTLDRMMNASGSRT